MAKKVIAIILSIFVILSSALLLIRANNARADDAVLGWAVKFGETSGVSVFSSVTDSNGNLYSTGQFTGTVDFDPGSGVYNLTNTGNSSSFILKLDSSGNFVWANKISSSSYVGAQKMIYSNGSLYISGYFYGTADFDSGEGTTNMTSDSWDGFILKLDSSGNFSWVKKIGAGSSLDNAYSVSIDFDGNVYAIGTFGSTVDFDSGAGTTELTSSSDHDAFILKLDPSGDFVWVKQFNIPYFSYIVDVAFDSSNNLYIQNSFGGTVDFDPGSGTVELTSSGRDVFILKLDPYGDFTWVKRIGNNQNVLGGHILVDSSNKLYAVGYFDGTVDFDSGSGTTELISESGYSTYLLKLDSSGDFIFAKKIMGEATDYNTPDAAVLIDADGNIYTTGNFIGTVDVDPGSGVLNFGPGPGIYASKLDSTGNLIWAKGIISPNSITSYSSVLDVNNNLYLSGDFNGTTDFDPGSGTYNLVAPGNSSRGFLLKLVGPSVPTVEINQNTQPDSITQTSANLYAYITSNGGLSISEAGFYYTTESYYNSHGNGYESFISEINFDPGRYGFSLDSLTCGTTYHYQAYSTNSFGTGYSNDATFQTSACPSAPIIEQTELSAGDKDPFNMSLTGAITDTGGSNATRRGFYFSINPNDVGIDEVNEDGDFGTGSFSLDLPTLLCDADYYYKPFAINTTGTGTWDTPGHFHTSTCAGVPVITTDVANSLTPNTVYLHGTIISGLDNYTGDRGFQYGISSGDYTQTVLLDPGAKTGKLGQITYVVNGLTCSTQYYYRALVSNEIGYGYGSEQTFTTIPCEGVTNTNPAADLTDTTANLNGVLSNEGLTSPTVKGFDYGTDQNDLNQNVNISAPFETPEYTIMIDSLVCETTYYFQAYSTNASGTSRGTIESFQTSTCPPPPTIEPDGTDDVGATYAILRGIIDNTGGQTNTERGFQYGVESGNYDQTINESGSYDTGGYSLQIENLACNTTYYFRPYSVNNTGAGYGEENSFITGPCVGTTITGIAENITKTTATLDGELTDTGGQNATERGFNYGTDENDLNQNASEGGDFGADVFSLDIEGLNCNTTYYFQAYTVNSTGQSNGTVESFQTLNCSNLPGLSISSVEDAGRTYAVLDGIIDDTGGEDNTERGFQYGVESGNYDQNINESGLFGTGEYSLQIENLVCNTTYYFRAYSVNSEGTGYSNEKSFITRACSGPRFWSSYFDYEQPTILPIIIQKLENEDNKLVIPKLKDTKILIPEIENTILEKRTKNTNSSPLVVPFFKESIVKPGVASDGVLNLQKYLNQIGFSISANGAGSKGKETNFFGPSTKAALIKFQKAHNIYPATGNFGPKTKAVFEKLLKIKNKQ